MIRRSCLCLLVLFTTTVGSDDSIRFRDVRARLPLPRLQTHSCRDFGLSSFVEPAWIGRTYSPSDTNTIRSPFPYTVRTYSDTNATRYPQFQYCINILVIYPELRRRCLCNRHLVSWRPAWIHSIASTLAPSITYFVPWVA